MLSTFWIVAGLCLSHGSPGWIFDDFGSCTDEVRDLCAIRNADVVRPACLPTRALQKRQSERGRPRTSRLDDGEK